MATLVSRGSQGITVTPAGHALYRNAQTVLRQLKQLESDVKSAGDYVDNTVSVQQLADVPLVLPSHSNGLRALVDAAFSRHGLKPQIIAEIDFLSSLRAAAECGFAATILPRSAAGADTGFLRVTDIGRESLR